MLPSIGEDFFWEAISGIDAAAKNAYTILLGQSHGKMRKEAVTITKKHRVDKDTYPQRSATLLLTAVVAGTTTMGICGDRS